MDYGEQILKLASTIDLPLGAHKYLPYTRGRRDFYKSVKAGQILIALTAIAVAALLLQGSEEAFRISLWILGIEFLIFFVGIIWYMISTDRTHREMEEFMRNYNSMLEEMGETQEFGRHSEEIQTQYVLSFLRRLADQVKELQRTKGEEAAMPVREQVRRLHNNAQGIGLIERNQGWGIHFLEK